jgi:hypothetical protein
VGNFPPHLDGTTGTLGRHLTRPSAAVRRELVAVFMAYRHGDLAMPGERQALRDLCELATVFKGSDHRQFLLAPVTTSLLNVLAAFEVELTDLEPEVAPGYPDRVLPKDEAAAAVLRTRTLTNLYNERPSWLDNLHRDLDRAVAAAYGWPEDIATEDALARLLAVNLERAARQGAAR